MTDKNSVEENGVASIPHRSHDSAGGIALRELQNAHRLVDHLWHCANSDSFTAEEMFEKIDKVHTAIFVRLLKAKRAARVPLTSE